MGKGKNKMFKGLYIDKPLDIAIKEISEPDLLLNQVRICTEFAAIKHGTEFHHFSGTSPFHARRFDTALRLFVEDDGLHEFTQQFVGNMAVGVVTEVGDAVTKVRPGERVYCYAPVCEVLTKAEDDVHLLVSPMVAFDAVCLDPALYAFTAVHDAKMHLGENVLVFGLGAIGLFIIQMLRLSGCLHIIAVDPIEKRRALAREYGASLCLDPLQCDVGLEVHRYLRQGADAAIEASGNYKALASALRSVGQCARVITLGFYKGKDTELELGAEWHHNRLELISSMPTWNNPSRLAPLWNVERSRQTLVEMFCKQLLTSRGIIDPVVDFSNAAKAFVDIYHNPVDAIKLGIRFC